MRLPIDTKSLYFNVKNDNAKGHTATVATPLKKTEGTSNLEDILKLKNREINISTKDELVSLLTKHSKTKVLIENVYVFDKISVNGKIVDVQKQFGCYIKKEIDETKVRYGRLKLHYPSKFIYSDDELDIDNKYIYNRISEELQNYAFLIQAFEYDYEKDLLNFDALIIGENSIPYSKVFISEKGAGNKFNIIFNEIAEDYDREIIALRSKYGEDVNPYNFMEYSKKIKLKAYDEIRKYMNLSMTYVSDNFPYSLYDFYYIEDGIKKYGILRVTSTKNKYFNLSFAQQIFAMNFSNDTKIFLVTDILVKPIIYIYSYNDLDNFDRSINSIKYEED